MAYLPHQVFTPIFTTSTQANLGGGNEGKEAPHRCFVDRHTRDRLERPHSRPALSQAELVEAGQEEAPLEEPLFLRASGPCIRSQRGASLSPRTYLTTTAVLNPRSANPPLVRIANESNSC